MDEAVIKTEVFDRAEWQPNPHSALAQAGVGQESIGAEPSLEAQATQPLAAAQNESTSSTAPKICTATELDGDEPVTIKFEILEEEPQALAVEAGIFGLENSGKTAKRAPNFTTAETELLLQLIERKRNMFECKKTDQLTVQKKNQAWKTITAQFNSQSDQIVAYRSENILRKKYENLKKVLRKRATAGSRSINATDGVLPVKRMPTENHEKSQSILHDTQFNSMDSVLDSECIGTSNVSEYCGLDDPLQVSEEDVNQVVSGTTVVESKKPTASAQETFVSDVENSESWNNHNRNKLKKQKNGKFRIPSSNSNVFWAKQAYIKAKWTELKAKTEIRIMEKEHEQRIRFMQEKHEIEMKILHQQLKSLQN